MDGGAVCWTGEQGLGKQGRHNGCIIAVAVKRVFVDKGDGDGGNVSTDTEEGEESVEGCFVPFTLYVLEDPL